MSAPSIPGIAPDAAQRLTRALAGQHADGSTPQAAPSVAQATYLTKADDERRDEMRQAWHAYNGHFPTPLTKEPNKPDLNVVANRCGPIVKKGVSFLFGQAVGVEVTPPVGQTIPQARLDDLNQWLEAALGDADDLMTLLTEIATNGGVCGHSFVKVLPGDPDADEGDEDSYPQLVNLDPRNVTVQTEPDNHKAVRSYCIEYDCPDPSDPTGGRTLTKRQIITRVDPDTLADVYGVSDDDDSWVITNYVRKNGAGQAAFVNVTTSLDQGFVQDGAPEVWPFVWAPIADAPNLPCANEHWGESDLTSDIISMNIALNFVLSNINAICYAHGHPWVWTNSDLRGVQPTPGHIIQLNDPQGSLQALTSSGDLANLMAHAESVRADMDEASRIPAVALGRLAELPKGNISGVALQMLFQPLLEKTQLKRRLYGKLLRELCRRMLMLGGLIKSLGEVRIQLHWKPIMPADDLQAAQVATALAALGFISEDTIMIGLGLSPDAENAKVNDEEAKKAAKAPPAAAPPTIQAPALPVNADGSTPGDNNANPTV